MDRRRPEAEGEQRAAKRLSVPLLLPPPAAPRPLPPAAPRPLQPYNPQLPDPLQPGRLLQPLPRGAAYGLWRQLGASPLPLPPPRPQAPILSPGWPACSPEKSKEASEDATSPRAAAGVHVLAADIREASTSGRVSGSVEKAVFLAAGAGGGAVNPSLASRNRKTELDLEEPSPAVRRLVQAFEALLPPLAAVQGGAGLMQEAWTALLGCVLTGASMSDQLSSRVLHQPAFADERLTQARLALVDCAVQADAVLVGLCATDAALAALEAMQRVAIRLSLPFYSTSGALHVFPWLEQAIYTHVPSLRPAGLAGHPAYQPSTSSTVNAGLAQLAVVHEALEDVTRGLPEAAREAAAVGVLAAAGAAIMRAHMRAGAADELLALRCLQPLSPADAGKIRAMVSGLLQTLAPLSQHVRKLAAAAELLERAARSMRLPADGWARATWEVLSALQL